MAVVAAPTSTQARFPQITIMSLSYIYMVMVPPLNIGFVVDIWERMGAFN